MRKGLLLVGLLAILLTGLLVYTASGPKEPETLDTVLEPYRAELSGEYVCLPHTDTAGPQTKECAAGLKTEAGDYYALDLVLMSQVHEPLSVGEHLSARGLVTPVERLSTDTWQKYPIVGIFSVTDTLLTDPKDKVTDPEDNEPYACQADAKICPDGSAVGRTGSDCTFAACPQPQATSAILTTYLGGRATALTVTVSPTEIVSDSRCPTDVACIWAGIVEVRTTLATQVSHGELVLTLGETAEFGDYRVTLIEVSPVKTQATIPESSYRFTYEIVKWN